MRFSSAILAVVALATSSLAQEATAGFNPITAPTSDQFLPAGSSFDITWTPSGASSDATVSITLLQGETPATLQLADTVAAGIPNTQGKYTWTVPASNFKTYGFKLTLDSAPTTFQYSNPFHITASSSSSSSSVASTSSVASITSTSESSSATLKALAVTANTTSVASTISSSALNTTSIISSVAPTLLPTSVNSTSASVPYANTTASATGASTVLTVVTPTPTKAAGSSAASTAAAASGTAKSGAVAKVASGSFALVGGLIMAFAL